MQVLAFSELDHLYTQILSLYQDPKFLVHTLGMIIGLEARNDDDYGEYRVNLATIAVITGFGEAKLHLVLRAL